MDQSRQPAPLANPVEQSRHRRGRGQVGPQDRRHTALMAGVGP